MKSMPCGMLPGIMHLMELHQVVRGAKLFESLFLGLLYLGIDGSCHRSRVGLVRQFQLHG